MLTNILFRTISKLLHSSGQIFAFETRSR